MVLTVKNNKILVFYIKSYDDEYFGVVNGVQHYIGLRVH